MNLSTTHPNFLTILCNPTLSIPPPSLEITALFFVTTDNFECSRIFYKWKQKCVLFLGLASSLQRNYAEIQSHCRRSVSSFSLNYDWCSIIHSAICLAKHLALDIFVLSQVIGLLQIIMYNSL